MYFICQKRRRATVLAITLCCLTACVSYDVKQGMQRTAQDTASFTGDSLSLAITDEQRQQRARC
jgi:hypothetical protein